MYEKIAFIFLQTIENYRMQKELIWLLCHFFLNKLIYKSLKCEGIFLMFESALKYNLIKIVLAIVLLRHLFTLKNKFQF